MHRPNARSDPKCNHGTQQKLRLATTVPWTGKTAVVCNDQPDYKGGCFLERLCFLLFIVQKSGFYPLRYEWNPSSAPHPPNFQRVVKLFILAGFRHTRYCWKNSDHHQLIWWKYTHYLQVVTATMSSFSFFVVEKSDEPGVFIEACPPPMRDPFFNGIFTYMDAIYPIISTIHVGPVNIAVHQVILPPVCGFLSPIFGGHVNSPFSLSQR